MYKAMIPWKDLAKNIFMPLLTSSGCQFRGSPQVSPECATLDYCDSFELKTVRAQKTQRKLFFSFPLNCLKEFRQRSCSRMTTITEHVGRTWGTYAKLGAAWQGLEIKVLCVLLFLHGLVNICLPNICSSHLPVNCFFPFWSPRPPTLFSSAQNGT